MFLTSTLLLVTCPPSLAHSYLPPSPPDWNGLECYLGFCPNRCFPENYPFAPQTGVWSLHVSLPPQGHMILPVLRLQTEAPSLTPCVPAQVLSCPSQRPLQVKKQMYWEDIPSFTRRMERRNGLGGQAGSRHVGQPGHSQGHQKSHRKAHAEVPSR